MKFPTPLFLTMTIVGLICIIAGCLQASIFFGIIGYILTVQGSWYAGRSYQVNNSEKDV